VRLVLILQYHTPNLNLYRDPDKFANLFSIVAIEDLDSTYFLKLHAILIVPEACATVLLKILIFTRQVSILEPACLHFLSLIR
jgi:hypothetical protein